MKGKTLSKGNEDHLVTSLKAKIVIHKFNHRLKQQNNGDSG